MRTIKRIFRVNQGDICYIRSIVESYDGMAIVSTVHKDITHIRVLISPGCEHTINELMACLSEQEGFFIENLPVTQLPTQE